MASAQPEPAAQQLENWKKNNANDAVGSGVTASNGALADSQGVTATIGPKGPITLYDTNFFEQMTQFTREKIPARVVHAVGGGAFGHFECTDDISDLTIAKIFGEVGKKTPIVARFSMSRLERGSPETMRDSRGFAVRFITDEGFFDLTGINSPMFSIRDPKRVIAMNHAMKRNPATHLTDPDMEWDFYIHNQDFMNLLMFMYSEQGIPDGWEHMDGFALNTYSLINKNNELRWVKFSYTTNQGIKNLTQEEADEIAGKDCFYATRKLYNLIGKGQYPSWTLYIQTMTPEQAENCTFNPFDPTKVWPDKDYPLQRVGVIELNRNPTNYFAEIEQVAFCPSNLVPGIGFSPDLILQSRIFAYPDAQRYRLGSNFHEIPINCPSTRCDYIKDGTRVIDNQGGAPNYYPNSFKGPNPTLTEGIWHKAAVKFSGQVGYYSTRGMDDYSQPRTTIEAMTEKQRKTLVENIANNLGTASKQIREKNLENFEKIQVKFAQEVREKIEEFLAKNK